MTFGRKKPDPPQDLVIKYTPADNEARARVEAARWKDADPADLADAVRAEAQRLFAPTGATIFPSRHEFNSFAGMVIALCDLTHPPQERQ